MMSISCFIKCDFLKKKEELSDWVSSSYVAFNLYFCLLELYHELLKSKRPRLSVG